MKTKAPLYSLFRIAFSAVALVAPSAHAATYYWDGDDDTVGFGTATGTWAAPTTGTTTSGWSTDAAGTTAIDGNSVTTATTDAVNFGNGAVGLAAGTIAVSDTVDSGNMTFATDSDAIVLSGGIINLAAATTITVNNTTNTIASDITGAGTSLTKAGSGTLVLSGSHTRSGTTAITGGKLVVRAGTLGTGAIVWATNNTSLQFQSDSSLAVGNAWTTSARNVARTLVLDRLTAGDANDLTYTFSSQFLIDTGCNLTFSAGSNITSGTPTVNFSSTAAGGGIRSTDSIAGTITLTPNGVNVRANGFSNTRNRTITLAGTSIGNEIYGVITQNNTYTASIVKSGSSTWTLSGANTYVGTTTITGGTLKLGANNVIPNTSNVTIGSATLDADTRTDTAGTLNATGASSVINLSTGAALAFANSSGVTLGVWAGALNITGTFVAGNGTDPAVGVNPGSLRFGVDNTGLSAAQLAVISVNGSGLNTATLDAYGYLVVGGGGLSAYDTWAASKGLTGASGSATDPAKSADPDNDGSNNLSEFAFNGDPLSGSDNGKVFVLTEDSDFAGDPTSAEELILTIAVRAGTPAFAGSPSPSATQDGITYRIEGSLDLASFPTTVNVVPTPVVPIDLPAAGTGYEYRSFSLDGSDGLSGKGFLRAKVTSP